MTTYLTGPSNHPDPLIPLKHPASKLLQTSGKTQTYQVYLETMEMVEFSARPCQLRAQNARRFLDIRFPNQKKDGPLLRQLKNLSPETVLHPKLTYAFCTSMAIEYGHSKKLPLQKEHVELGILAQAGSNGAFNSSNIVTLNQQYQPDFFTQGHQLQDLNAALLLQMANEQISIYEEEGILQKKASIYDVGSDYGLFIAALLQKDYKHVTGVEPYKQQIQASLALQARQTGTEVSNSITQAMKKIQGCSIQTDLKKYTSRSDLVFINNINPDDGFFKPMLESAAKKTKKETGTLIISISGSDPHRCMPDSDIESSLKKLFKSVAFINADQTRYGARTGQYGNMIGFYRATVTFV